MSLRKAIVRPHLKKSHLDKNILGNYRPVSNLAFIGKLIEKIILKQLNEHLSTNDLLDPLQSAYRVNHSTETAILRVHSDIAKALDQQKATLLVLLDLSAAFDTIDTIRLLNLLQTYYGISGNALALLRSYLTSRTQSVRIDQFKSEEKVVKHGVPQGSVLGPVLFTLYTAPLSKIIQRHGVNFHKYADDTQLYTHFDPRKTCEIESAVQTLESCLHDVSNWMRTNFLKLNEAKTEVLIVASKHQQKFVQDLSINIGGNVIKCSNSVRNLGAIMDSGLTMIPHTNKIVQSCHFYLRQIGHIRPYLNENACKSAVQALVISRIDNHNILLNGTAKANINRLQLMQNKAARLISRSRPWDHITPVLKQLHWLPIEQRIAFKTALLVFKSLNGQAPTYISDLLELHSRPVHLRRLDQAPALQVPRTSRLSGKQGFSFAASLHWNKLPAGIRNSSSVQVFKNT